MCFECFDKLPHFCAENKEFILWCEDKHCIVGFSQIPDIGNKEINKKVMSKEEIKSAKKKPLYLKNSVDVFLFDKKKNKKYLFKINKKYDYDGASIPRIFWRLIGSKESIEFKIAALIHDVLCENHNYVDNDRYFADKVFQRLLEVGDVGIVRSNTMFFLVDNFQKFCGWSKKK